MPMPTQQPGAHLLTISLSKAAAVGRKSSAEEILKSKNGVGVDDEQLMRGMIPGFSSQSRGETHVQIANPVVLVSDMPSEAQDAGTPREQRGFELDEDETFSNDIDICVWVLARDNHVANTCEECEQYFA